MMKARILQNKQKAEENKVNGEQAKGAAAAMLKPTLAPKEDPPPPEEEKKVKEKKQKAPKQSKKDKDAAKKQSGEGSGKKREKPATNNKPKKETKKDSSNKSISNGNADQNKSDKKAPSETKKSSGFKQSVKSDRSLVQEVLTPMQQPMSSQAVWKQQQSEKKDERERIKLMKDKLLKKTSSVVTGTAVAEKLQPGNIKARRLNIQDGDSGLASVLKINNSNKKKSCGTPTGGIVGLKKSQATFKTPTKQ